MQTKTTAPTPSGRGLSEEIEMIATIRTTTDERSQHTVLVTIDGIARIYARNASAHVIAATCSALRADIARHGDDVIGFADLPAAEFRTTKAGKRLLIA